MIRSIKKYFTLVEIDVSFDSIENMLLVNLLASQIRKIFAVLFEDPWDFEFEFDFKFESYFESDFFIKSLLNYALPLLTILFH